MEGRVEELVQEGVEMKKRMDSMDAKMTSVNSKVDSMGTKMTSVNNRVNSMDAKMTSVNSKVDSMGTKINKVDEDVKMNQIIQSNGWKYLGRGYMIGGIVEESYQGTYTLAQCCQKCEDKHSADSPWNGFLWKPSSNGCWCEKNDRGHDPTVNKCYMHFLKQ